jgi:hypothetical protein
LTGCADCSSTKLEVTEPIPLCASCNGKRRKMERKGTGKKPRSAIRHRSKKRASEEAKYNKEAKEWLLTQECCHHGKECPGPLTVHHSRGRQNQWLRDKKWWKAVCWPIHQIITENSAWAELMGYSYKRTELFRKDIQN